MLLEVRGTVGGNQIGREYNIRDLCSNRIYLGLIMVTARQTLSGKKLKTDTQCINDKFPGFNILFY